MLKVCGECGEEVYDGEGRTYCPKCEGYLEEAKICPHCGSIVPQIELDQGYCTNCQDTLVDRVIHTLEYYFTPHERKMFREFVREEDFEKLWEE